MTLALPFTQTSDLIRSCAILALASAVIFPIVLFLVMRLYRKVGLMDEPHKYPHEKRKTPLPLEVGTALYINFLLIALTLGDLSYRKLIVILVCGGFVILISLLDRLHVLGKSPLRISPLFRLIMQIGIGALIGITSIKIGYISNIFGGILYLDQFRFEISGITVFIIPFFFTIIWYVLVMNSLNWSDAVPGMASGLGGISLFIIGVLTTKLYLVDSTLASQENSQFVLLILSVLLPSVIIFWCLDHTRRYFLSGDSGSMFLAFMIATLAIISGGKVATVASVLGVYIIDAFYVILVRLYNKKNPLKGDMIHHLHFRLMNLGFSHNFIRGTVYMLSFICGMAAVFLDKIGKSILAVSLIFIVFFITKILSSIKRDEDI